jgi:hypothetical protein
MENVSEGIMNYSKKQVRAARLAVSLLKSYTVPVPGKEGRQNSLDRSFFSTLCVLMLESLRRLG